MKKSREGAAWVHARAGTSPADNAKGCCKQKDSFALLDRLKALTKEHGLKGKVRATASGCLDDCGKGPVVFIFSSGQETWYTRVQPSDADALFESHILCGQKWHKPVTCPTPE